MINALLEDPAGFKPERYHVGKEMCSAFTKEWQFCVNHQREVRRPPSIDVFARQFPNFEILRGVDPRWAADKLRAAYRDRVMRKEVRSALSLLNDGSIDEAQQVLRGLAKPIVTEELAGLDVFDPATVDSTKAKVAYPTPWDYLTRATEGGVGLGELWYIGARTGQGKSMILPCYATSMAESGASIGIVTLEMPKESYIRRIHRVLARNDAMTLKRLRSPDKETRLAALKGMPGLPGKIKVFDPSDMTMDTKAIRRLTQDYQYVVIDHMGLMLSDDGTPAIKDWRVAAEISNETKRISLEERAGIVGAVQINREGIAKGFQQSESYVPPKISNFAGSDDLGRDCDIGIVMLRLGERAMMHDLQKNRNLRSGRFYTSYDPDNGRFEEISKDEALKRAREDEAANRDN